MAAMLEIIDVCYRDHQVTRGGWWQCEADGSEGIPYMVDPPLHGAANEGFDAQMHVFMWEACYLSVSASIDCHIDTSLAVSTFRSTK